MHEMNVSKGQRFISKRFFPSINSYSYSKSYYGIYHQKRLVREREEGRKKKKRRRRRFAEERERMMMNKMYKIVQMFNTEIIQRRLQSS